MKKFLGFLSAAVLILGVGASSAHAESFSLGGSFDGFGGWSHSDKNGPPVGRSQAFLNELPTICSASNALTGNCVVNFTNGVTPLGVPIYGDTDFGVYETSLSIVGAGEINEYADMVFRLGVYAPGSGNDTALTGSPGEVSLVVEQAYADFHTDDGELGMSIGRLAPNVGTSLHSADRGSPFLSIARSKLLPTLLTGGMAYYKSGDITVSAMLYNDLAGTNNQSDLDLGYSLAAAYSTDEMSVRLSWFGAPEAFDAGQILPPLIAPLAQADPDNKNWVNVINLITTMNMDEMSAYLDLTWRRDGFAGSKDPQAIAIGLGGEIEMTDMLFGGLALEWVHGNNDAGFIPVGLLSGTAGINDEDTVVLNPYFGVHLAERTGLTLGYNLEHRSIDIPGLDNNRNFHTVYVMATAVFDSGSEPRSPTLHPLN